MPGVGTGPGPDAFTLSDTGRGGLERRRSRPTILERKGEGWVEVERFRSSEAAASALDASIASGTSPTDLRLSVVPRSRSQLALISAAIFVLVVAAAAALSVVLFGS